MTVTLKPNNSECYDDFNCSNEAWFTLLREPLKDIIPHVKETHDDWVVTSEQATACAYAMKNFNPPSNWGISKINESGQMIVDGESFKSDFMRFFYNSEGFVVS